MPNLRLLPLGTVVKPKDVNPAMPSLRYMITGYFPCAQDGSEDFDYNVTPWPLGYLNMNRGDQLMDLVCNEEAIGSIEFVGLVNDELIEKTNAFYDEAVGRADLHSPLAMGRKPMIDSLHFSGSKEEDAPYCQEDRLPLGTVVSIKGNGGRRVMIWQHAKKVDDGVYDYGICAWPDGVDPGRETIYLIKKEDITAVHFRGYENALSQELAKRLEKKRRGSLFSRIIGKGKSW